MIHWLLLLILLSCNNNKISGLSGDAVEVKSEEKTENFPIEITNSRALDILLVIDNSGSMSEEQKRLSEKLNPLLEHIDDTDWQIAIATTDSRDCIQKIITKDNQEEFEETVQGLGTEGAGDEQVVWKTIQSLKGNCLQNNNGGAEETALHERVLWWYKDNKLSVNQFFMGDPYEDIDPPEDLDLRDVSSCRKRAPWLREDSTIAVLLVTDEDHNCHEHYGCKITDMYFYLNSIRVLHSTAKVYGLLNVEEAGSQEEDFSAENFLAWKDGDGESIFDHYASINDDDYTETLNKISLSIASAIQSSFNLERIHDGKNVKVIISYDNKTRTLKKGEYHIDGKTLTIVTNLPDNTERVEVVYTHNPETQ